MSRKPAKRKPKVIRTRAWAAYSIGWGVSLPSETFTKEWTEAQIREYMLKKGCATEGYALERIVIERKVK